MSKPNPLAPVSLAMVVLAGDTDAARKSLRSLPKDALVVLEAVQVADLRHGDQRQVIAHTLINALGRAIDRGELRTETGNGAVA